jgi:phosphoglycolate phosphatase-like HAD superfamily hydrolase
LLACLTDAGVSWAIAPRGGTEAARAPLGSLGVDFARDVIITRVQVRYARPDPDLLLAAAPGLGCNIESTSVAGDSISARAPGVGVLSGGYGAGAYRVYHDPKDRGRRIDEVGGLP